jgi:hypothetical protein
MIHFFGAIQKNYESAMFERIKAPVYLKVDFLHSKMRKKKKKCHQRKKKFFLI